MSSYGSQHAFPHQSPYSPYPQPGSNYFPPTTQQPPPPPGAMAIPQPQRQYSHPHNSYGSQHNNSYPAPLTQPYLSTSPQMQSSYLAPSDAAQTMAVVAPPYAQTHSYQQQPMVPRYERRSSLASHHSHHSHRSGRSRHTHDDEYDDGADSRDVSTDSSSADRRHERKERSTEHRPSVGEAVYRTFKYIGGLLDPKRN
ncbi:hypothetical protein BDV96DRAFT_111286 [Lophiotrema nucula]|uniref:Uncharacterized protein n=1 Tax=Lophiotrema nucula TaxID=690887 RepID=A0A6A5Z522_9PLEO|nr:hypothetical protein BDV96DRAFT_111286 [Lophiotrema nucula]